MEDFFKVAIPYLVVIFLFYFIVFLPQMKKTKKHKEMVDSLKKGDKVITLGGIKGVVESVDGDSLLIKSGPSIIDFEKNSISRRQ